MDTAGAFDRRRQRDEKRMAIIKTAARAFDEKGYEGASLDAIADRLGVTKKALYYYVENKHDILHAIFDLWMDAQEGALDRAEEEGETGLERLKLYARYYVSSVISDLTPMDRIINEIRFLSKDAMKTLTERRRTNDDRIVRLVEAAIAEGSAAAWEPRLVVNVLNGSLDWMFKWYRPGGKRTAEEVVDGIIDLLFQGLQVR